MESYLLVYACIAITSCVSIIISYTQTQLKYIIKWNLNVNWKYNKNQYVGRCYQEYVHLCLTHLRRGLFSILEFLSTDDLTVIPPECEKQAGWNDPDR